MKKVFYVYAMVALVIVISSCVNSSQRTGYNDQQASFDKFLSNWNNHRFDSRNDIQKAEFLKKFESDLYDYVDSAQLFVNWVGRIEDISTRVVGKTSTQISFNIYYTPEQYRKVEFNCLYLVDNDSLETDHIYNIVKNISNGSTVYFDGFIRTTNSNTVKYFLNDPGDDMNLPYPHYDFYIVEVGTASRGDSLSLNLRDAVESAYKISEPLKLNYQKKISNAEQKARWKALVPGFKAAKEKLTKEENDYLNRLINALTMNYLYGDN
jgi:hypothetical protein